MSFGKYKGCQHCWEESKRHAEEADSRAWAAERAKERAESRLAAAEENETKEETK